MYRNSLELKELLVENSLPRWLSGKESACRAGDVGSVPGLGKSPREGLTTHSRILAWEIPWTEEPGGLQSVEMERVRYDFMTKQQQLAENRGAARYPTVCRTPSQQRMMPIQMPLVIKERSFEL